MSLLLLIDGYNVIAPVAPPNPVRTAAPVRDSREQDARWLHQERTRLIERLVRHLEPSVRSRTCVVFDAANPPKNRPDRFHVEGIDVRFAIGYNEADDLLEELIASQSAAKSLAVVSSDHRVQAAAKRRGSVPFDSQPWLDDLLDGKVRLAVKGVSGAGQGNDLKSREKPNQSIDKTDVEHWMREFGF